MKYSDVYLFYGQKVKFPTNPIKHVLPNGMGLSSSDTTVMAEFIVSKYFETDHDTNSYKVKLIPTDTTGSIGYEKVYSHDLKRMIADGRAEMVDIEYFDVADSNIKIINTKRIFLKKGTIPRYFQAIIPDPNIGYFKSLLYLKNTGHDANSYIELSMCLMNPSRFIEIQRP